jgi:D-3-phosphoglycerate dehydrogenase / 2-oxoglutarate reductase
MSAAITIPRSGSSPAGAVSISPTTSHFTERFLARKEALSSANVRQPKVLHPVDNDDLKLLVLENISQEAVKAFQAQGFKVDHHKKAMSEDELLKVIGNYHAIGIRSKTKITERVIKAATKVSLDITLL